MANIVKSTEGAEQRARKQNKRQSSDFNEIWNVQTECNVTEEKWDAIFHNYENPLECNQDKRVTGCSICDKLRSEGKMPTPTKDSAETGV